MSNRAIPAICLLLASALFCGGCLSPSPRPPATPQALASTANGILDGFDRLREPSAAMGGADVLYQVEFTLGDRRETSFLRIKIHDVSLEAVDVVHINPPHAADDEEQAAANIAKKHNEHGSRSLSIRDPGQSQYDLKTRSWSLELSGLAKREDGTVADYEFTSGPALAWVALYDSAGELRQARYLLLPEKPLRTGFYNPVLFDLAAQLKNGLSGELEARVYPAFVENIAALQTLTAIVLSTPLLRPIVDHFVPFVVKLSAIFSGMRLGLAIQDVQPNKSAIEGVPPAYLESSARISFEVRAGETPVVAAELVAAKAGSPLSACGGVLALSGRSVTDPSRRFDIRLVAARRLTPDKPAAPARIAVRRP